MTEDDLLDAIGQREGLDYGDETSTPPRDQPTGPYGLTLPIVQAWATSGGVVLGGANALRTLPPEKAREIARWHLRQLGEREGLNHIVLPMLRLQMLDFAWTSGRPRAIRWLQRVLNVPRTGQMDLETQRVLNMLSSGLVHHALIAARVQMIHRSVAEGLIDKRDESGLLTRALSFSRLEVP